MRWLRPKRPLRPERKQRKKVPVQAIIEQGVSIVVNVVRAFEVMFPTTLKSFDD